jgi:hypothetical protein
MYPGGSTHTHRSGCACCRDDPPHTLIGYHRRGMEHIYRLDIYIYIDKVGVRGRGEPLESPTVSCSFLEYSSFGIRNTTIYQFIRHSYVPYVVFNIFLYHHHSHMSNQLPLCGRKTSNGWAADGWWVKEGRTTPFHCTTHLDTCSWSVGGLPGIPLWVGPVQRNE